MNSDFLWVHIQTWDCRTMWFLDIKFIKDLLAGFYSSCTHLHPNEEGRMILFFLSPLRDLVSVDLFDAGLSKQYEVILRGGFDWPRFRR